MNHSTAFLIVKKLTSFTQQYAKLVEASKLIKS
jgi:hypothetical protein